MKQAITRFTLASLLIISTFAQAKDVLIIDAGSSGSRIYLYQGNKHAVQQLKVEHNKVKPGLSSYADNPGAAAQSIIPLLQTAKDALNKYQLPANNIDLYLYATAGMRLVDKSKQAAIYEAIRKTIIKDETFNLKEVRTISGQEEATFGWLAVNQLEDNFKQDKQTTGIMELGGASLQISYAVDNDSNAASDYVSLNINDHPYKLFAHSFLGLGQNLFASKMDSTQGCYVKGYQDSLGFDLSRCKNNVDQMLSQYSVEGLMAPQEMDFIAYSSFEYTQDFFKPKNTNQFLAAVSGGVCQQDWQSLQRNYQNIPSKYLGLYCINGVYSSELFTQLFKFSPNSNKIQIKGKINNTEISWTAGAALLFNQGNA